MKMFYTLVMLLFYVGDFNNIYIQDTVTKNCGFPFLTDVNQKHTIQGDAFICMKELKINSPKYGEKIIFIDDDDLEKVNTYKWHLQPSKSGFYAVSCVYVSKIKGKTTNKYTAMHSLIMDTPKGMHTDRRDGNTLNNQKENLRVCTPKQNHRNSKIAHDSKSGLKGVRKVFNTSNKVWQTRIRVDGILINGGHFSTKEEAALKYNELAIKHFGEYAKLNSIPNDKDCTCGSLGQGS